MQTTKRFGSQRDAAPAGGPEGDRAGKVARTDRLIQRKARSRAAVTTVAADIDPPASDVLPSANESFVDSLLRPIQRRATAETSGTSHEDGNDAHAAASAGIAGPPQALPHLEAIQASFGAHDLSGVKAHLDTGAATAATAIGATAFATGDHVAFAGPPDLHTAAHEAAHVVQQRSGVQLKRGVGESGDSHERHADAVADAVVRGESAEHLLGQGRAPASGARAGTIQRQVAPADRPVTQAELRDVATKMNLINAYARQMEFVFESMKAGVRDTCDRLESRKSPRSDVIGRMIEIAASAAIAGVAGVVAEAAAKRIAGSLRGLFSASQQRADAITIYLQSSQRFLNDGFKEIVKKSVAHGSRAQTDLPLELLSLDFQRAQDHKIDEARQDFILEFGTAASDHLLDLPVEHLEKMVVQNRDRVLDPEIRAMSARNTAVEWSNLVAQLRHGDGNWDPWQGPLGSKHARPPVGDAADRSDDKHERSEGNVSPDSESILDLVDTDQRKMNPASQGILEIDLRGQQYEPGYGFTSFQLFTRSGFGMRLGGVSEHVKRMVREHARVGDLKMNKIVSVYSSRSHLEPPKPDTRFLITADGYIRRWTTLDSGDNLDAAATAANALAASRIQ